MMIRDVLTSLLFESCELRVIRHIHTERRHGDQPVLDSIDIRSLSLIRIGDLARDLIMHASLLLDPLKRVDVVAPALAAEYVTICSMNGSKYAAASAKLISLPSGRDSAKAGIPWNSPSNAAPTVPE